MPFAQLPGLRAPAPALGAAPGTLADLERALRDHVRQMQAAGYLRSMLSAGQASADELGLGLRATARGVLLDAAGRADERLRVLGPLRRGELWESTAVGKLREQAATVAADLHSGLARDAWTPAAVAV